MSVPSSRLAPAFEMINSARDKIGMPRFLWDDRLYASAQELCEYLWKLYRSGGDATVEAHHDLVGRMERAGWTISMTAPPDARRGIGNYSECQAGGTMPGSREYPPDPSGWAYPPMSTEDSARRLILILLDEQNQLGPDEPHVRDFHSSWTHIGIGHSQGMFALDYGYLPGDAGKPDRLDLW
jgi:hypothetical protein